MVKRIGGGYNPIHDNHPAGSPPNGGSGVPRVHKLENVSQIDLKILLEEVIEVGLHHWQHLEYGNTFCDDDCNGCELERKIYEILSSL